VLREISEHNHYIQGVAWDPLAEYIATQSSDRSVHVHQLLTKANEYAAVQTVSRNTRMDVHHRRGGSHSNGGHFLWDPNAKPPMKRSASSHASHASDSEREGPSTRTGALGMRTGRSSTPLDVGAASLPPTHYSAAASGSGQQRASTPTLSHQSPAMTSMNPPQRTPSRRSSFSGSQIEALSPPTSATSLAPYSHPPSINNANGGGSTPIKTSALHEAGQALTATASTSRSASRNRGFTPRSPSPAPPLPAIRAPPSPKQRMANAVYQTQANLSGVGTLAKAGMRLYGDENFSGFFRRLTFSPDGALLVTPTGIFENSTQAALNQMQSPASPTVSTHISRRKSEQEDMRASPASPLPTFAPSPAAPPPAASAANLHKSTVYLYGRGNLHKSNAPIAHLPGHKTASLVIKFSPILYDLRKTPVKGTDDMDGIAPHPNVPLEVGKQKTVSLGFASSATGIPAASSVALQDDPNSAGIDIDRLPKTTRSHSSASSSGSSPTKQTPPIPASSSTSMIGLPYRMIFAVATHDSVWIYDTQQGGPLCCFSNMHYASFTDLTWSSDGQTLMMCSTDGYCSVVVFDYGELGVPYQYQSQPSLQAAAAPVVVSTVGTALQVKSASLAEAPTMLRRESGAGSNQSSQGQDSIATGSSHGLGLATEIVEGQQPVDAADDLNPGLKKKRRIAPTLQGPIGS
jgi:chromatin assembly factor 1 subunit B